MKNFERTFMKKLLLTLVIFASVGAHATRARLVALSQDTNGSFYIMDTRNIFLNPAQLSVMKDHLNFEWGKRDRPGTVSAIPENEGGFVMALGAGKIAAQLGRVSNFDNLIREVNFGLSDLTTGVVGGNLGEGQNNLDAIYSASMGGGMQWGAGLALTRSKTATGAADKQTSVSANEFRGGVHTDHWEGFGSLILGGESKTEIGATDGKLSESFGLRGGGGFQLRSDFRLFGTLEYDKYNATRSNGGADYDAKRLALGAGAVYLRSLEENARLFASARLNYLDHVAGGNKGLPDEKLQYIGLPVTMGIEADANTWARVRASVQQNVLIGSVKTTSGGTPTDSNKWENAPNSTSVAAGVGASANRFNFDVALAQALVDDGAHVQIAMTYIF